MRLPKRMKLILDFFPGETEEEKLLSMARSALKERLRNVSERISELEAKYAMTFEEFAQAWEEGRVPEKWSFDVERDYFDWEALLSEKKRLLERLRSLKAG